MNKKPSLHDLFRKYLAGECSPDEIELLLDNFNRPDNEKELRDLISDALNTDAYQIKRSYDGHTEEVLRNVKEAINKKARTRKSSPYNRRSFFRFAVGVAASAVLITGVLFSKSIPTSYDTPIQMIEVAANADSSKEVTLTDGTRVWLKAGSKLSHPLQFASAKRQVVLRGEAFFEVTRDEKRPFEIRTNELLTTVLGTSFNIKHDSNEVKVTVKTGKVRVSGSFATNELTPGRELAFNKNTGEVKLDEVEIDQIAAWRNISQFHFRDKPMSEVIHSLEEYFGVRIDCLNPIKSCEVYADFALSDSLEHILKILMLPIDGQVVRINESHYQLNGKKCS